MNIILPNGFESHIITVTLTNLTSQLIGREVSLQEFLKIDPKLESKIVIESLKNCKMYVHIQRVKMIINELEKCEIVNNYYKRRNLIRELENETHMINVILFRLDPMLIVRTTMDLTGHMRVCSSCDEYVTKSLLSYSPSYLLNMVKDSSFRKFYNNLLHNSEDCI